MQFIQAIKEAGNVLCKQFGGSFRNVIKAADQKAQNLINLVISLFPTFNDVSEYNGMTVYLYKRAQILVADLWACFEGKNEGRFDDIDTITMFADYRVPQALVHVGLLHYDDLTLTRLKNEQIPPNDSLEVEIRCCSIWAVELLCRELKSRGQVCNAILIDFFLWDLAKARPELMKDIPIHKTRTQFY